MALPLFDRVFRVVLATIGWLLIVAAFTLAALLSAVGIGLGNCTDPVGTVAWTVPMFVPVLLLGLAAALRLWPRPLKDRAALVIVGTYVLWCLGIVAVAAKTCA